MFDLEDTESSSSLADWIELELGNGESSLSKSKVSSVVEEISGYEPSEALLSFVWQHLEIRQERYLHEFYKIQGDIAIRASNDPVPLEYIACLLFSLYGISEEHRPNPKIFERIAAEAIKNYLQGEVFVFGWPVLTSTPVDIGQRVKAVATAARERFVESPAPRWKDRGVDVIAWKPFQEHVTGEHRSGQLVILAQCAAGKNWREKTTELPYPSWTQYIHWACDPLQGFAVPQVITDDLWHEISRESGILFDRIRIVNLLPDGVQDADLRNDIEKWIKEEIQDEKI